MTEQLPRTGSPDLEWIDGDLFFAGAEVASLAEKTGTPAFVFLESRIEKNLKELERAFTPPPPWRLRTAYSIKTALEPELLAMIARLGAGAEVSCENELDLALRAGFSPGDIFLDGPVHPQLLIERAMREGLRLVKVDSIDQLNMVAEIAGRSGQLGVSLRVRALAPRWYSRPAEAFGVRFGMDEHDLRQALSIVASHERLVFMGLAMHLGSQVTSPDEHARAIGALASAYAIADGMGLEGSELNIGGGFPSPSLGLSSLVGLLRRAIVGTGGTAPDPGRLGEEARRALERAEFPKGVRELVIEPGRAIVGNAAILLTRVAASKKGWLLLDASRNFVGESLLFAGRKFLPASPGAGLPWKRVNLAGSTLNAGDVLSIGARLPRCAAGDLLAMMDAGAYTLSRANRFTTSVPPAYLLDADGKLSPMSRKEPPIDVVGQAEPR